MLPSKPRITIMPPATSTTTAKPKPVAAVAPPAYEAAKFEMPKFDMPKFDMPKFDMPKFDIPKMEVPEAFRAIAEKGIAQAKDNYEKVKSAAEKATDMLEESYTTASQGCSGYGLKLIETARSNSNAAFDLYGELLSAKSYSEVVEKTTAYMRTQFETLTAQAKVLAEHAQKVAADTAEPIKETMGTMYKVA
jgi:phasin